MAMHGIPWCARRPNHHSNRMNPPVLSTLLRPVTPASRLLPPPSPTAQAAALHEPGGARRSDWVPWDICHPYTSSSPLPVHPMLPSIRTALTTPLTSHRPAFCLVFSSDAVGQSVAVYTRSALCLLIAVVVVVPHLTSLPVPIVSYCIIVHIDACAALERMRLLRFHAI